MDTQDIVVLRYVKNCLPIIKHGNMIYPDLCSDGHRAATMDMFVLSSQDVKITVLLFTEEGRLSRSCDNVGCVGKGLLRRGSNEPNALAFATPTS